MIEPRCAPPIGARFAAASQTHPRILLTVKLLAPAVVDLEQGFAIAHRIKPGADESRFSASKLKSAGKCLLALRAAAGERSSPVALK